MCCDVYHGNYHVCLFICCLKSVCDWKKNNTLTSILYFFICCRKSISFMNKPLISVITVVRNDVSHIEQTMLSVLNQTYPNVEYIVIDGGSTDGTVDIIMKYATLSSRLYIGVSYFNIFRYLLNILLSPGK